MNVLIVSPDRLLVRHVSRFLSKFDYQVREAADAEAGLFALRAQRPDFLIFSWPLEQGGEELCREAARGDRPPVFTLHLTDHPSEQEVEAALAAGVDDFLAQPVVYGELLSRLRAGARVLEAQRRLAMRAARDPLTGLPLRQAILAGCIRKSPGECRHEPAACVVIDIDGLGLINALHGLLAGDAARRDTARRVQEQLGEGDFLADLGGGRFATFTPHSMAEAAAWAERVRQSLADAPPSGEAGPRLTASFGVAPCAGDAPDDLREAVEGAEEALAAARHSGRNCVMCVGDCDRDTKSWTGLGSPAKLFASTQARHVMFPCTVVVREGEPLCRAAALFQQTGLPYLPVVNGEGKYRGFLSAADVTAASEGAVEESLYGDVPAFDLDAPFNALMDRFVQDACPLLAVVHEERPVGYVLRQGLATLVQPVRRGSYSPAERGAAGGGLVVPVLPSAGA